MTVVKQHPESDSSANAGGAPDEQTPIATATVNQLVKGTCVDVFAQLGMHPDRSGNRRITVFLPGAISVEAISPTGRRSLGALKLIHEEGLFSGVVDRQRPVPYKLKVQYPEAELLVDDPYRFPSMLDPTDLYLFNNGTQEQAWRFLGANHRVFEDTPGVLFAVWAPNARRVSLVSSANHWDGRVHVMRRHADSGIWEIFIPGMEVGTPYKYEIVTQDGRFLPLKADPYARQMQLRPDNASEVPLPSTWQWQDAQWMDQRRTSSSHVMPVSIYEVHLASWKRNLENATGRLTYRELAEELLPYVKSMGFTHLQLLPVSEYPFDDSWGYQPLGLFAATRRFGLADDLKYFIDRAHCMGLGVLLDWVPGHFPTDAHGLANFDGTHLYEHSDPRKGFHPDWNTCIFNYGRAEVASYLLSNALYWLDEFHIDGLRFDAVASMLYLDYSRKHGEWIPNHHGGRENIDAIELLKTINRRAYFNFPGVMMVAEESTAWPGVTNFTERGGLGFGFKWNMGWMNDTLRYISRDPVHRKFHHNEITFSLLYSFSENFILPLSHDEVVHGKHSILDRVPGDEWQKFATLRTYYTYMWTHPGKKLMFMGDEFAQRTEWNSNSSLDWHLLQMAPHQGIQNVVSDLNALHVNLPALHEMDCSSEGFEWVEADDYLNSIFVYRRKGRVQSDQVLVVLNFTPTLHPSYRIGVPAPGFYAEKFNSDAVHYNGSGTGNLGGVHAQEFPWHGQAYSIEVVLPALTALIFALA